MPLAEVEKDLSLTTQLEDGRWVKLRSAVRLHCRQDEATLDQAAELGLKKVNEYVGVGIGIVSKGLTGQR
jgi:hypothetical protein